MPSVDLAEGKEGRRHLFTKHRLSIIIDQGITEVKYFRYFTHIRVETPEICVTMEVVLYSRTFSNGRHFYIVLLTPLEHIELPRHKRLFQTNEFH